MPEMPELDAVVDLLDASLKGHTITRYDVVAFSALKTADPPHASLVGGTVSGFRRRGKYLLLDAQGRHAVIHLSLAGWLRLHDAPPTAAPKASGPVAARMVFDDGPTLDVTEQGKRRGVALWISDDPLSLDRLATLGPEADHLSADEFQALLAGTTARIKNVLTNQKVMAGIGNAWSDEILHRAQISPFAQANRMDADRVLRVHTALHEVVGQVREALDGVPLDRIKRVKKSLYQVHDQTGRPCPVCGTEIAQVSFADRSLQYCPGCQTDGKRLNDRRADRFLK